MKKLFSLMLAIALVLCTFAMTSSALAEADKVVLAMPSIYDMTDAPEVQDAINAITEEKYGISFELLFVPMGNWTQQSNLLLTVVHHDRRRGGHHGRIQHAAAYLRQQRSVDRPDGVLRQRLR